VRKPKDNSNLHARFPKAKVEDGTLKDMTRADCQIYLVLASHFNFGTYESGIGYRHIRSHIKETSGDRVLASIKHLMEMELIGSRLVPFERKDGSLSDSQMKRVYHIRIGKEWKKVGA